MTAEEREAIRNAARRVAASAPPLPPAALELVAALLANRNAL